jgi:hypothetical protein
VRHTIVLDTHEQSQYLLVACGIADGVMYSKRTGSELIEVWIALREVAEGWSHPIAVPALNFVAPHHSSIPTHLVHHETPFPIAPHRTSL